MATEQKVQTITLVAAADLSAKQYCHIKVDSNGKAAVAAAGEFAIGILQNNPGAGQAATVAYSGVSKVLAGGTVAAGATVKSDSNGKAADAMEANTNTSDAGGVTDPLVGSHVSGIALESAVAGDIFPVLLTLTGAVPTNAA